MKAYRVTVKGAEQAALVFASNRDRAKGVAAQSEGFALLGLRFVDIRVRRFKAGDTLATGCDEERLAAPDEQALVGFA